MNKNVVLISIIIPVYNVECYLVECVQSIINQTYSNLEIILVDDGSSDSSPEICDNFARKDKRIKVLHKKNEGVSVARNAGIEIAKGAYIGFVDSDDFIDPKMYEILYNVFIENENVGISSCMTYRYENGQKKHYRPEIDITSNFIINSKEFSYEIVAEKVSYTSWNKLYKRDLVENIRFRKDRLNEDMMFNYDLANNIEKSNYCMVEIPDRLYYYRCNPSGYTSGKRSKVICMRDMLFNLEDIESSCNSERIINIVHRKRCSYLLTFIAGLVLNKDLRKIYFKEYHKILKGKVSWDYAKRTWGIRHRFALVIAKYMPDLFRVPFVFDFCFKRGTEAPF